MSLDVEICRKFLKDETNRQMLCLLGEKGELSSAYLMTALNVTPRLFDYHVKVLADFIVKTVDDKYVLSEKGKQIYDRMDELSKTFGITRRWKVLWFVTTVSLLVTILCVGYVFGLMVRFTSLVVIVLFFSALSYYTKVHPEKFGRVYYVGCGAFLGILLFLFTMLLRGESYFAMFPPGSTGDNILAVLSFVVCCIIGGVVGELIGKKMQYRWPPHFSL